MTMPLIIIKPEGKGRGYLTDNEGVFKKLSSGGGSKGLRDENPPCRRGGCVVDVQLGRSTTPLMGIEGEGL